VSQASPETGINTLNMQWQVTFEPPVILVKIYFYICFLTLGLRIIHVALSREFKRGKLDIEINYELKGTIDT
jgi:hypothetical protein